MGLTHYWYRPTELPAAPFAAAVEDIGRVLKATGLPLAGFQRVGDPIIQADAVVFTGGNGAGVEPFEIHLVEFDQRGRQETFSYCKTEGLPYDLAVRAALIVLKHHLNPQIRVMSDADDETWDSARQLVQRCVGFGAEFRLDPKE